MTRPLLIIFLTIFVNLIGFGIIIPLLPFYAERFSASPIVIGLLFAIFSLCQLLAAPVLRLVGSVGRRPVLVFSLIGTVVSFVMLRSRRASSCSSWRASSTGCRAATSRRRAHAADITEPKDRAAPTVSSARRSASGSSWAPRSAACSRR
jgi:DHA1 family tetracycline resistance protein-like MFS transporter